MATKSNSQAICEVCEDDGCDSYSPIMRQYFHRACIQHRVDNPDNNRARRATKNLLEDLITLGEEY